MKNFSFKQYVENKDLNEPKKQPKEKWESIANHYIQAQDHMGAKSYPDPRVFQMYLKSLEPWEKRANEYFHGEKHSYTNYMDAKRDPDPRVFLMYLKLLRNDRLDDSEFEKLTPEQKKAFVMGKSFNFTDKQKEFVKAIIQTYDYYSSFKSLDEKMLAAGHLKDEYELQKIAKMPDLDVRLVDWLIRDAEDKEKRLESLSPENRNKLSDKNIDDVLSFAKNRSDKLEHIAELLGPYNLRKLSDDWVYHLLVWAYDKEKIAELLGSFNISKLSYGQVHDLVDMQFFDKTKQEMLQIINKYHQNEEFRNSLMKNFN